MLRRKFILKRTLGLVVLMCIPGHQFLFVGQTRRGASVASNKASTSPSKCSGAWTGTITYTRSQSSSNSKTVDRVSGRGQDTTNFEMSYNYKAQVAVVESPERNGSSIGKGQVSHTMTSSETVQANERNSCDRGKSWQVMSGTSTSKTETTGNEAVEANVNVGINSDGTYTVSVGLPQIQGKTSGSQMSTCQALRSSCAYRIYFPSCCEFSKMEFVFCDERNSPPVFITPFFRFLSHRKCLPVVRVRRS